MKMSKGWKQFERTLLVLLVLLLFVLTGPLRLKNGGGEQSRVTTLRTGWYQLSDGVRKEIQLPVRMEVSGEVRVRETEKLEGLWVKKSELASLREQMEGWSKIAMEAIV